jgi:hypothetical protein
LPDQADWARSVVTVGDGRGFVVESYRERFVITAGHCLPELPPYHGASYTHERTFARLLGAVGRKRQSVWAECLFADPIADLAVLGSPDGQELYEEAQAFEKLIERAVPLPIADVPLTRPPIALSTGETILGRPTAECRGWMLSLEGRWFPCSVVAHSRALSIKDAAEEIRGGMSGSPIVNDDGAAIGAVCVSTLGKKEGDRNPFLARALPGWLLSEIAERAPC